MKRSRGCIIDLEILSICVVDHVGVRHDLGDNQVSGVDDMVAAHRGAGAVLAGLTGGRTINAGRGARIIAGPVGWIADAAALVYHRGVALTGGFGWRVTGHAGAVVDMWLNADRAVADLANRGAVGAHLNAGEVAGSVGFIAGAVAGIGQRNIALTGRVGGLAENLFA